MVILRSMLLGSLLASSLLSGEDGNDAAGDPLPEQAIARFGTVRWRQGGYVNRVALSPDGKTALSASTNRTVTLWDVATGRRLHVFEGHTDEVCGIAFSPSGELAASSGHDRKFILWDLKARKAIRTLESSRGHGLAFSPDGSQLLTGGDSTMVLWDVATGAPIKTFEGHTDVVQTVAFAGPTTIVSASPDRTSRVWSVRTGKELRQFTGHGGRVWALAVSPDGKVAATGGEDKHIRLWEIETSREIRAINTQVDSLVYVAFSPDGKRLLGPGEFYGPAIWDVESGSRLADLKGHVWPARSAAFSPDGTKILSGGRDRTLALWDLGTGLAIHEPAAPRGEVVSIALSPAGNALLTQGVDGTLSLWNLRTGGRIQTSPGSGSQVGGAAFSADGREIFVASSEKFIDVVDTRNLRRSKTFLMSAATISISVSPDGRAFLAAGLDNAIFLKNASTGAVLRTLPGHNRAVLSSAFSFDGRVAASGAEDGKIILWDVDQGRALRSLEGHRGAVKSLAFNSNGQFLLSGSLDQTLALWEVGSGRRLRVFEGHEGGVSGVAFCPDDQYALSASWDRTVRLWDLSAGKALATFSGHVGSVNKAVFTSGGRRIISGSTDTTVLVWQVGMDETRAAAAWAAGLKPRERESEAKALLEDLATRDFRRWLVVRERLIALGEEGAKALVGRFPPEQSDPVALDESLNRILVRLDDDAIEIREAAWKELRSQQSDIQPWLERQLRRKGAHSIDVQEGLEKLDASLREDPTRIGGLARLRAILILAEMLPLETARLELRRYATSMPTTYAGSLARSLSTTEADDRVLAEVYLEVARRAADIDDYARALSAAADAERSAAKAGDRPLREKAGQLVEDLGIRKRMFDRFVTAEATLSTSPADPDANLVVGSRLCLTMGRWDKGLPHLEKGSNAALKDLAARERAHTSGVEAWVDLGDRWRHASQELPSSVDQEGCRRRAREWYEKALGALPAGKRGEVAKKLSDLAPGLAEVDLLRLIDPKEDAVQGEWSMEGGALRCVAKKPASRLLIPYRAPEEYDLELTAERTDGGDSLSLGLANSRFQTSLSIDGYPPRYFTGFELLDGNQSPAQKTAHTGAVFTTGKESVILCRVRKEGITLLVDGKEILNWKGDLEHLTVRDDYTVPNPRALFLGTWDSLYTVRRMNLRPLSADGKVLR